MQTLYSSFLFIFFVQECKKKWTSLWPWSTRIKLWYWPLEKKPEAEYVWYEATAPEALYLHAIVEVISLLRDVFFGSESLPYLGKVQSFTMVKEI